jgi:hypothetical protein
MQERRKTARQTRTLKFNELPDGIKEHVKFERRTMESWQDCIIRLLDEHKKIAYDLPVAAAFYHPGKQR